LKASSFLQRITVLGATLLSNSPKIVSGSSKSESSSGVVDIVTMSPTASAKIPRKSMSPAVSPSLPPLVVKDPNLTITKGAVAMASLAGSCSVITAPAGAASSNDIRAARNQQCTKVPYR
jgi:hypothetical protein